jgi:hypothetical protein
MQKHNDFDNVNFPYTRMGFDSRNCGVVKNIFWPNRNIKSSGHTHQFQLDGDDIDQEADGQMQQATAIGDLINLITPTCSGTTSSTRSPVTPASTTCRSTSHPARSPTTQSTMLPYRNLSSVDADLESMLYDVQEP